MLRDELKSRDIDDINIHITALGRMIAFFERYESEHGEYEYVTERIRKLQSTYAEYKVAFMLKLENIETTTKVEG